MYYNFVAFQSLPIISLPNESLVKILSKDMLDDMCVPQKKRKKKTLQVLQNNEVIHVNTYQK